MLGTRPVVHAPRVCKEDARPMKVNSEILDRQPPCNLEAERGVLGSILLLPLVCDDVALVLRPEDFYSDANCMLYKHMLALHESGKRVDTMLLAESLKTAGNLDSVGGAAYLAEILQSVPTAANVVHYAQIVKAKSTLRALITSSTEILRDAYDANKEPRDLLNAAEQKIFSILDERSTSEVKDIRDILQEAMLRLNARMDPNSTALGGVETGFTDFDALTGGLHDSELSILAARPSMGKTALALNIAEFVTMQLRLTTLFVSLEMSRIELADRLLCSRAQVDGKRVRNGTVTNADRGRIVEQAAQLSECPLFIDDSPSRSVTEISAAARRLRRKSDLRLIVIDYLQLIEPDNYRDQRHEQVGRIARRLKGLARELRIPVLCLAQLNRQAEETRPSLSHLRESGSIEQDADVVMFIHRERTEADPTLPTQGSDTNLIIAKQRNGPVGDVPLAWSKNYTRFQNSAQRPYDEFERHNASETY